MSDYLLLRGQRRRGSKTALCLLVLLFLLLGYVLLAVGVHTRVAKHDDSSQEDEEAGSRLGRHLKSEQHPRRNRRKSQSSENDDDEEPAAFLDVMRLRPKPPNGFPGIGVSVGGASAFLNPYQSMQKMSDAEKEELASKMRRVEAERQDLYLKALKKRGQLVALGEKGGGQAIISFPGAPLYIPNVLKYRPVKDWLPREIVWTNLTHYPWPNDDLCKDFSVKFSPPGSRAPPVGLVSYPGSGNTWMRYLIEATTGVFTGSMYNDIYLKKEGLYGEGVPFDSGMTSAVKSHGAAVGKCLQMDREEQSSNDCGDLSRLGRRAVLLLRDPFAAIVSHRNLDAGGHKTFADPGQFKGEGWDSFFKVKIGSWESLYTDWLDSPETEVEIVHFEQLTSSPKEMKSVLRRVSEFLGLQREMEELRLRCVEEHSEGRFHRMKKKEGEEGGETSSQSPPSAVEDPFTPSQILRAHSAIARVNAALKRRGKEALPVHLYRHPIP